MGQAVHSFSHAKHPYYSGSHSDFNSFPCHFSLFSTPQCLSCNASLTCALASLGDLVLTCWFWKRELEGQAKFLCIVFGVFHERLVSFVFCSFLESTHRLHSRVSVRVQLQRRRHLNCFIFILYRAQSSSSLLSCQIEQYSAFLPMTL